jgi:L-alanine-DL-glutamate epimerase-like enolase superfamily enzyme
MRIARVICQVLRLPAVEAKTASAHWLSTCRGAFLFEDSVEESPLRHQLTLEKIQAENGWIEVPDRAGLGVTLNEPFGSEYLISESGRE